MHEHLARGGLAAPRISQEYRPVEGTVQVGETEREHVVLAGVVLDDPLETRAHVQGADRHPPAALEVGRLQGTVSEPRLPTIGRGERLVRLEAGRVAQGQRAGVPFDRAEDGGDARRERILADPVQQRGVGTRQPAYDRADSEVAVVEELSRERGRCHAGILMSRRGQDRRQRHLRTGRIRLAQLSDHGFGCVGEPSREQFVQDGLAVVAAEELLGLRPGQPVRKAGAVVRPHGQLIGVEPAEQGLVRAVRTRGLAPEPARGPRDGLDHQAGCDLGKH